MYPSRSRLALLLALTLAACAGDAPSDRPPTEAPADRSVPGWLADLPARTVDAEPGETVWAAVPDPTSGAVAVATYRLESAAGTTATVSDSIGTLYDGVPGALVHPLSAFPERELEVGAAVLADRPAGPPVLGRLTGLGGGKIDVAYDHNGETVTEAVAAVLHLPVGEGRALGRVAYPAGEGWRQGLAIAEDAGWVWIADDGGFVEVADKDAVRALGDLGREELEVGREVEAFSWDRGFRRGVISEVLEPGLRYAVELADGEIRPFFFADLVGVSR